jgi:heme/copper-type cytochrome/quinol oxidase subunit 2
VSTYPFLRTFRLSLPAAGLLIAIAAGPGLRAQSKKDFAVSAHRYGYTVQGSTTPEIRVTQDDLVRITFSSDDIPHSFTLEDETYRIMRRAELGRPVIFEFRADKVGRFPFRCTLTIDDRCQEMEGWLIVEAKKETPRARSPR